MAVDNALAQKVISEISPDELAQLVCDLSNIHSPTGHERTLAEFILDWYRANGIKAIPQIVDTDRVNAVGILKGTGTGLSLMFNGHLDTSFTGTDEDLDRFPLLASEMASAPNIRAEIHDGKVFGLAVSNMKSGLAAFMVAAAALQRSGVSLKGDVILAAVTGEISRTPIGPYQSGEYRGEGIGTRHLLTHGVHPDYAVVADGSGLHTVWAQNGVVDLVITVYGAPTGAWGTSRSTSPPAEMNAVVKMARVIQALELWGERFEEEEIYQSARGPLLPKVNIGGIEGGSPFKPNYFPGYCRLYVDIRIPPHLMPVTVQYKVKEVLDSLGIEYELDPYRSLRGYEGKGVEPLVNSVEEAYQHLVGRPTEPETAARTSIWTDTNVYNELGIPAIKFGPRGNRGLRGDSTNPRMEEIEVEVVQKAAQVYALVALDICTRPRLGNS